MVTLVLVIGGFIHLNCGSIRALSDTPSGTTVVTYQVTDTQAQHVNVVFSSTAIKKQIDDACSK